MNVPPDFSKATRNYRQTSYWLESAGDDLTPRSKVSGDVTVDVAILGGGFSGLWTAYYLLRNNPDLDIVIVEKDICGYGASGRNGGWCSPRFPIDPPALEQRVGRDRTRQTILALHDTVDEIGRVCEAEGIDAHFRARGLLNIARGAAQMPAILASHTSYERLGLGHYNQLLNAEEAHERVHATGIVGGMFTSAGASVHPGRLVRGLARAVERLGGIIYEQTPVTGIATGERAALMTDSGRIAARRAIVTAGEAYMATFNDFHRDVLPMSSMIVLTEPLSDDQWRAIGWADGASLSSQSHTKNYLTRTVDGRILYGSRGAPYHYGSRIPDGPFDEDVFEWMRATLREWFPVLEDVGFSHAWGGYLGVPRDWMPTVNFDPATRLARIHGYTGRGVSTTNLTARLLAGLIGEQPTGFETLPFHRARTPRWEPEPLRWMAVRYIQNAYARIDRAEDAGRNLPLDTPLADFLSKP